MTAFLKTDKSSKICNDLTMIHPMVTKSVSEIKQSPASFFKKKRETVVCDLLWFLIWHAHPRDGRWRVAMNIQQLTLGALCKLYTAIGAKQTNHCWSHYRSLWLNRYSAADDWTGTCGCRDRKRIGFLNQNSSEKDPHWRFTIDITWKCDSLCFDFLYFSAVWMFL